MSRLIKSDRDLSRVTFSRDGRVRDKYGRLVPVPREPTINSDSLVVWVLAIAIVGGLVLLAGVIGLLIGGCP